MDGPTYRDTSNRIHKYAMLTKILIKYAMFTKILVKLCLRHKTHNDH